MEISPDYIGIVLERILPSPLMGRCLDRDRLPMGKSAGLSLLRSIHRVTLLVEYPFISIGLCCCLLTVNIIQMCLAS